MVILMVDRPVSQGDNDTARFVDGADHQVERWLVCMGKRLLAVAALLAGVYAALSPIWTNNPTDTNKGIYTMIGLGVITAGLAIAALYRPNVTIDGLIALMGVLFVVSPWVMSFTAEAYLPMAWSAWIVGLVSLVAGAAEFQLTRSEHRGMVTNH
jgi:hypothetical protein